jgi:CTP-dependent riboflavin kinase
MLKFGVTYESHIAELARIKDLALKKSSFSAAVNAETNRGKAGGLYIDRKIIKHGKLEDMTEEQLDMKMAQIEEDYASLLSNDAEVVEAIEVSEPSLSSSHKKSEKQNVPKK